LVARTRGKPDEVSPVAQQSALVGHDTAVNWAVPVGGDWLVQFKPPLVVATIAPPPDVPEPVAQQLVAVGQDTPTSCDTPAMPWLCQLPPPFEVATTTAADDPVTESYDHPTAWQSVVVAHEIA
jgi:hypothetical protein